jgi:hemerythrin-like domain-containing protein
VRCSSPTEKLLQEHGILRRILLVYEEFLGQLEHAEEHPSFSALIDTTTLLQGYVQGYHEVIEETYVFPIVEKIPSMQSLVSTLRKQHVLARQMSTDVIVSARMVDLKRLTTTLDALILLYQAHTAWEDTDLTIAYRSILSREGSNHLIETFNRVELDLFGPGAEADVLVQITEIERAFDIHGPAEFEP